MESARTKREIKREESARSKRERKGEERGRPRTICFLHEKKRWYRTGTLALWEIHKFQKSTCFLIRKLTFARWVREIFQEQMGNLRFQAMSLLTLQEAAEAYVVNLFKDANLYAVHTKRVTLMPKDNHLACRIGGDMGKYLPV